MRETEKALVFLREIKYLVDNAYKKSNDKATATTIRIPFERAFNINSAIQALQEKLDRENPQPLSLDRFKNFSGKELQTIQSALCWNISVVGDGDIRSDLVNEITGEILHRRKMPRQENAR